MKYHTTLTQTIRKESQCLATDRDVAYAVFKDANPDFAVGVITEILDEVDGEPVFGEEHEVQESCEMCDKLLWQDDKVVYSADECAVCSECAEKIRAEAQAALDDLA